MSHALRRLLLSALTSIPLLCGATYAYADDAEEEDDTEEVEEDSSSSDTTITIEGGYSDTDPTAVTIYTAELQPYGVWVTDGRWGTVWVPSSTAVGADFAPYQTSGHWELTADDEWLWVSDYAWGHIPFHYGRWVWIDGTGWAWIPGRAYAPAWVVWRTGSMGYIGWAPMPPAYYWSSGVYYTCSPPVAAYVFVSTTYVYERNVSTYVYRDKAEVTRAVDGTQKHQASKPQYGPAQPSPQEAHVTAPPTRGTSDPKAMKLAKKPAGLTSPGGGTSSSKKKSTPTSKPSGTKSVDAPASTPKVTKTSPKKSTTTTTPKPATTSTPVVTTTPVVVSKPATKTTTRSTPKTVSTPKSSTPRVVTPRTTTTTSTPKPVTVTTSPKPATSTPAPVVRKSTPSVRRGKR